MIYEKQSGFRVGLLLYVLVLLALELVGSMEVAIFNFLYSLELNGALIYFLRISSLVQYFSMLATLTPRIPQPTFSLPHPALVDYGPVYHMKEKNRLINDSL